MTITISARATPYREPVYNIYTCTRCGIERTLNRRADTKICGDCKDDAINLGWVDAPPTYECGRCGRTKQGKKSDMCGNCASNLGRYRKKPS